MKTLTSLALILLALTATLSSSAQNPGTYGAIYSGIPWFDDRGQVVSAHGACIVKDNGRFYLFGEAHSDTSNAFAGFTCYSSTDLYNWKFERVALPLQASGKLGPNRVGERVKVMKCPKTREYIMFMHADTLGYTDQFVGYATASAITGPYTFRGPLFFNGLPIRKWDMGTFQDSDGSGYVLIHGGEIYKLSDDYKSVTEQLTKSMTSGFESPAILKKDSLYYFLGSHLTSWERNDNYYYTATSLKGPWINRGTFAPQGTLTWNSQTTFILPITGTKETTYMYMGDRWSFPRQASSATYVWQPLSVSGTSLSLPTYREAWRIDLKTGTTSFAEAGKKVIDNIDKTLIDYQGEWQHTSDTATISSSNVKGTTFSLKFKGRQVGLRGLLRPNGGYAKVTLTNAQGKKLCSALVDMYCKYPVRSLAFLSPVLTKGQYTLTVTVAGEHGTWSDKRRSNYGSIDNFVSLDKILINN
ncbi:family 43 glycosylhydrolase [Spirosoma endbachense]|uniref:Family 43 glycosylhydrolase n=1 Tax=Spirosoma endbachense TaxID=2666025 RepID=A0A6P1VPF1_9BACT|nr:family 43 glycosylhydrolase [Spirosoma endbachense]QHV94308.1 family 43 glycosylhydrolase [Spirosoma endbachense]